MAFALNAGMSVGAELAAARQTLGLSLEDIAQNTKIPVERLSAIEAADVDQLPSFVYLKGFLRAYAAEVHLDPDDITERYLAEVDIAPPPDVLPAMKRIVVEGARVAVEDASATAMEASSTTEPTQDADDGRESQVQVIERPRAAPIVATDFARAYRPALIVVAIALVAGIALSSRLEIFTGWFGAARPVAADAPSQQAPAEEHAEKEADQTELQPDAVAAPNDAAPVSAPPPEAQSSSRNTPVGDVTRAHERTGDRRESDRETARNENPVPPAIPRNVPAAPSATSKQQVAASAPRAAAAVKSTAPVVDRPNVANESTAPATEASKRANEVIIPVSEAEKAAKEVIIPAAEESEAAKRVIIPTSEASKPANNTTADRPNAPKKVPRKPR